MIEEDKYFRLKAGFRLLWKMKNHSFIQIMIYKFSKKSLFGKIIGSFKFWFLDFSNNF